MDHPGSFLRWDTARPAAGPRVARLLFAPVLRQRPPGEKAGPRHRSSAQPFLLCTRGRKGGLGSNHVSLRASNYAHPEITAKTVKPFLLLRAAATARPAAIKSRSNKAN